MEKPDIAQRVLKGGIDRAGDPLPVAGGQRWVPVLQLSGSQPPHVAGLEEEQLPSDGGGGVKGCVAGIRLLGLPKRGQSGAGTWGGPLAQAGFSGQ